MKVEGRPHGLKTQAGREGRHLTCKFNSQRRKTDNTRQMRNQGARKEDSEQSSQTLGQEKEEESSGYLRLYDTVLRFKFFHYSLVFF